MPYVPEPSRLDKSKEAARQVETDDDSKGFTERLVGLVKHSPASDAEKPE